MVNISMAPDSSEPSSLQRQETSDSNDILTRYLTHRSNKGINVPQSSDPESDPQETEDQRIERLGRQRPLCFRSSWQEFGFIFSIIMTQMITEYFLSGFTVIIPTVVKGLNIPPQNVTWPASAFSLVISSFLLSFGRVADIYGGYPVFIVACAWYTIWSLVAGLSQNELMLDFCRALQGLGPAAYLPAGMSLLGTIYRPGPRKNLIFSIYGAMSPFGFFVGIFFAGVSAQFASWRWYFYIGTIIAGITTTIAFVCIPSDRAAHKNNGVKMDWWGSFLTISGLVLVVFAITDSAHAPNGWRTPYIPITFCIGVLCLFAAIYVEGWVAEQPLLPPDIFRIRYMNPMIVALMFAYGTLGIYLLYTALYCQNILGTTPMQLVAWYVPMGVGGILLATLGGFVLHRISGTLISIMTCLAIIADSLLFALLPPGGSYWAFIFPAMICATVAIDLIYNTANIFLTTNMSAARQGLAGGISNALVQLGIALLLGFADIVVSGTMEEQGEEKAYKNAFWLELAFGGAALVIFAGFVRIPRPKSDLTFDEKARLQAESDVAGQV